MPAARSPVIVLDRLLRGRAWVLCVGGLLAGIVFFNVSLLELNAGIARTGERVAALKRENAGLRTRVAALGSSERIQSAAAARGFVLPAPGDVEYLNVAPARDARRAVRTMTAPAPIVADGSAASGPAASGPAVGQPGATATATDAVPGPATSTPQDPAPPATPTVQAPGSPATSTPQAASSPAPTSTVRVPPSPATPTPQAPATSTRQAPSPATSTPAASSPTGGAPTAQAPAAGTRREG